MEIKNNQNFYSQYGEDKVISEFIDVYNGGNILELGANDGKTLSNSLSFIELGWGATLIEASPFAFDRLNNLHNNNPKIQCLNICLAEEDKKFVFYHNTNHLGKGDIDLLSTISEEQFKDSSKNFNFSSFEIDGYKFTSIEEKLLYNNYDIISIDIEGLDYEILKQINLTKYNCKILVIEYNNNQIVRNKIIEYCKEHNLNDIVFDNKTNIILKK